MAAKKNVDFNDPTSDPSEHEDFELERPPEPKMGSRDAAFMLVAGLGALAFGLVLAIGPKISWKLAQVTEGFSYLGVHGGTLLIGGVVLTALGLLRRGQHLMQDAFQNKENEELVETMASDVVHLRTTVAALQDSLDRLGQEMHGVENRMLTTMHELAGQTHAALQSQPVNEPAPSTDSDVNQEAIYRLAASLDQVGARIDQRLRSQYSGLEEHLGGVLAAVASARDVMEQVAQKNLAEPEPMPELPEPPPALGESAFRTDWTGMSEDEADDSDVDVDPVHGGVEESESEGPAVAAPQQLQANLAAGEQPSARDTQTKLQQLSDLLADEEVRDAFDAEAE